MLEFFFTLVTDAMNLQLNNHPTEEEISKVVFSFHPDKAPSPSRFLANFYKHFWNVIKIYLRRMIGFSLKHISIRGGIIYSFLVLIPKESNPSYLDRFRPISLYNVSYKILSKI